MSQDTHSIISYTLFHVKTTTAALAWDPLTVFKLFDHAAGESGCAGAELEDGAAERRLVQSQRQ